MLTRPSLLTDMKRPLLALVKQSWLERQLSLNCEGGKLREMKWLVDSGNLNAAKAKELKLFLPSLG